MQPRLTVEEESPIVLKWRKLGGMTIIALIVIAILVYLISQYRQVFCAEKEITPYEVGQRPEEDTLRVIFIGDSWAEFHANLSGDTIVEKYAKEMYGRPFKSWTRGKGGAMSKEIYHFMFSDLTVESPTEPDRCTQPLLESHPDYCVIYAGINDAIFQRSLNYYAGNYRLILRLLLHNHIRPVVMQMPRVDALSAIDYKPWHKRTPYHIKAFLLGTSDNHVPEYRQALIDMLTETGLKDSVLYIEANKWNPNGWQDTTMFTRDRIHLSLQGYHSLDSCIVSEITKDYRKQQSSKKKKYGNK